MSSNKNIKNENDEKITINPPAPSVEKRFEVKEENNK